MLIDTETGEVEWRRVEYPVEATRQAMHEMPLPRALADRLLIGR
jgi:hypothetical protein